LQRTALSGVIATGLRSAKQILSVGLWSLVLALVSHSIDTALSGAIFRLEIQEWASDALAFRAKKGRRGASRV